VHEFVAQRGIASVSLASAKAAIKPGGTEPSAVAGAEALARIGRIEAASVAPGGRVTLKPYEAAFVLRCSENAVRRQLRRGELTRLWDGRRLSVGVLELAQRLKDDLLALEMLNALAEGWFVAPRNFSPKLPAPPLSIGIGQLHEHLIGSDLDQINPTSGSSNWLLSTRSHGAVGS
jgi:hypothetical protein